MLGMGPMEVAVILLVAFIFLGPQKMIGGVKTLGEMLSQMRKITRSITDIDLETELSNQDNLVKKLERFNKTEDDRDVDCVDQEIDDPIPYDRRRKPIHLNNSEDKALSEDNLDAKDQIIGRD